MSSATSAVKVTKKVTKKTDEPATVVAAVAPVATKAAKTAPVATTAAPAATPAPAARTKKAAAPVVAAPAPAPVAAVTAAPVETTEAPVVSVQDDVKAMLTQANTVRETVGSLVAELKRLEKRVARLQKEADKRRRKSKKPVEGEEVKPRKLSIFELPTPLSNDLCGFLGVASGSKESRSNVTKAITTYVKLHELKNKHTIVPDAKLTALLGVKEGEVLTYFNLQRYLNHHYLKTPAATATA
jgi:hypothetical protein